MKRLNPLILGACLLGLILPSAVMAAKADGKKAKLIAQYDKNGNGNLDGDELGAVRSAFEADPEGELKAYDKNADGKLSDEEIQAIKPGAAKKPKAPGAGEKLKKEKSKGEGKAGASGQQKKEGDSGDAGEGKSSEAAE